MISPVECSQRHDSASLGTLPVLITSAKTQLPETHMKREVTNKSLALRGVAWNNQFHW